MKHSEKIKYNELEKNYDASWKYDNNNNNVIIICFIIFTTTSHNVLV